MDTSNKSELDLVVQIMEQFFLKLADQPGPLHFHVNRLLNQLTTELRSSYPVIACLLQHQYQVPDYDDPLANRSQPWTLPVNDPKWIIKPETITQLQQAGLLKDP